MDRFGPTLIVAAITLLVLIGMWWGWRRRTRRDAPLHAERSIPATLGDERVSFDAFYVATTAHDRPLERLAVAGLGFRARAHVRIHDAGLTLSIPGERPVFIAASHIASADRATATIDRVVEPGGLVRLAWRIPAPPIVPTTNVTHAALTDERGSDVGGAEQVGPGGAPSGGTRGERAPASPSIATHEGPGRSAPPTSEPRGTDNAGRVVDTYLRPIAPEAASAFLQAVAAIAPDATVLTQTPRKRGAA